MTAVSSTLADPLLAAERLNLSSLQIHGFIKIRHTNYYICADCSLAYLGYSWLLSFPGYTLRHRAAFLSVTPERLDCPASQMLISQSYYLARKTISEVLSPLSISNRGGTHLGALGRAVAVMSQTSAVNRGHAVKPTP